MDAMLTAQMLFKTEEHVSPAAGMLAAGKFTAVSFSRNFCQCESIFTWSCISSPQASHIQWLVNTGFKGGQNLDSIVLISDICD